MSDEDLAEAVRLSQSLSEALRRLGLKYAGGTHTLYRNRINRLGIDTSHFIAGGGINSRPTRLDADDLLKLDESRVYRVPRYQLKRAMLEKGVAYSCGECGLPPLWREIPLTLEIDHVNGNRWDNRLTNLRFLCPNCHTQTSTYANYKKNA